MKTLYLCYFGLREPLVQTQVLPYLRQLSGRGDIRVSLLTFEPDLGGWKPGERHSWAERLEAQGIRWHCLPYHKRPSLPATLFDVLAGAAWASRLVRRERIDVVHARASVAALMGVLIKRRTAARLIFDIRGFNPEEYVDGGVWQEGGFKFRLAKRAERATLAEADGFVVLTDRARQALFPGCSDQDAAGRPIEVIPCCVDLSRFEVPDAVGRERAREELGLTGRHVLIYVGALGGIYLTDELAELVAASLRRDPATFALILSQSPPATLARAMGRAGVPDSAFRTLRSSPPEIPRYLQAADLALSLRKPSYSQIAASPTKIAEYLACGLPVICNRGIGDVDSIIEGGRAGVVLRALDPDAYREALDAAVALLRDPSTPGRCRAVATLNFDLERVGGERYLRLYRRLADGGPPAPPSLSFAGTDRSRDGRTS